jgi:ribosomal protein S18 acetylase RimI-like enzyme
VEPFFKGKGIGRKLIQQVIIEARARKRNKIFLWVIEDNLSARKFYEKNGFVATGATCLIKGTAKTDMRYELTL